MLAKLYASRCNAHLEEIHAAHQRYDARALGEKLGAGTRLPSRSGESGPCD